MKNAYSIPRMPDAARTAAEAWMDDWSRHPMNGEGASEERIGRMWGASAKTYSSARYSGIADEVVEEMEFMGLLGGSVLDIGCGTGAYSVRFSPRCDRVVALDSSPEMLEVLRSRCEEASASNVDTVECDCRSIPDALACGTAFSSLCPAMNFPERILDMERLGHRRVYISSCDDGEDSLEMEVWRALGKSYTYRGYLTDHPYRFLRGMGRDPEMHRFTQKNEAKAPEDEMVKTLERLVSTYRDVTDTERSAIRRVVSDRSSNGFVDLSRTITMGMLTWRCSHQGSMSVLSVLPLRLFAFEADLGPVGREARVRFH